MFPDFSVTAIQTRSFWSPHLNGPIGTHPPPEDLTTRDKSRNLFSLFSLGFPHFSVTAIQTRSFWSPHLNGPIGTHSPPEDLTTRDKSRISLSLCFQTFQSRRSRLGHFGHHISMDP